MSQNHSEHIGEVELLDPWEGPAEHTPGLLLGLTNGEGLNFGDVALVELAGWVALCALSGDGSDATHEAIKANVRAALLGWQRRHGMAKLDELKRHVTEEMQRHRPNGKLTEEELQQRIDRFFSEIHG